MARSTKKTSTKKVSKKSVPKKKTANSKVQQNKILSANADDYSFVPGVKIREVQSLTKLVTRNATAIPIILHDATHRSVQMNNNSDESWNSEDVLAEECEKISSFKSFLSRKIGYSENLSADHPSLDDLLQANIKAYFDNGGGPFYLVQKDNILTTVPKLQDATLLVDNNTNLLANTTADLPAGLFYLYDDSSQSDVTPPHSSAKYFPDLIAPWTTQNISASTVVAGIYNKNDRNKGVWKAPANVQLSGDLIPRIKITDTEQNEYNQYGINCIREFPQRGIRVWGARTCAGDGSEWKYIQVRRFFDSVERDLKYALMSLVFEPNTASTWERARSMIDIYLDGIWREGGLMGSSAQEAYFVRVGEGVTMDNNDIINGTMVIEVGMAPIRPAEFIILKFSQIMQTV